MELMGFLSTWEASYSVLWKFLNRISMGCWTPPWLQTNSQPWLEFKCFFLISLGVLLASLYFLRRFVLVLRQTGLPLLFCRLLLSPQILCLILLSYRPLVSCPSCSLLIWYLDSITLHSSLTWLLSHYFHLQRPLSSNFTGWLAY